MRQRLPLPGDQLHGDRKKPALPDRENRQQYLDDICRHDLLVFDYFGGETNSNFFDINMEEIVKTCYRKYIPLIVITPMTQEALEQGLNPTRQRAVDRMKERCYCLTLRNTSRNRQITKERKEKMEKLLGIKTSTTTEE